jgi:hypothetical protein
VQNVFATSIPVPFGTVGGNPWAEPGVMDNIGCDGLDISALNIYQIIGPSAKHYRETQERYAAAVADLAVGSDYVTYFDGARSKSANVRQRQFMGTETEELTAGDVAVEKAAAAYRESKGARSSMAASAADLLRTSAVNLSANPVPVGGTLDVDWLYDGTNLERGVDIEDLEFITDDPDLALLGLQPILEITYLGGCLVEESELHFNTLATENIELVWNDGGLGEDDATNSLTWGNDPLNTESMLFEGAFYLAGDSSTATGGAQFHAGQTYDIPDYNRWFVPNVRLSDNTCGLDRETNVHLGWRPDLSTACPYTPIEILGEWVQSNYADTNEAATAGTPLAAIGTNIVQTEVGSYDNLYGDFKLIEWKLNNRDAVAKGPLYGGTFFDWDAPDFYDDNHGIASASFKGYAIWDWSTPGNAYGMLDPNQPSNYTGVDASAFPIRKAVEAGEGVSYDIWQSPSPQAQLYNLVVNSTPLIGSQGHNAGNFEDHCGLLTNGAVNLPANGTASVYQALFGVDATSNSPVTIEANAKAVARRSAKWAGFARGDVNDDGVINLLDACYLAGPGQVYPDNYNGDVNLAGGVGDAADVTYLLNYVSGLGPAPLGAWRFPF